MTTRAIMILSAGLSLVCLGCLNSEARRRLETLENKQAQLREDFDGIGSKLDTVDRMGQLAADLEAVKAYFKEVSDRMRVMRHDVVTALDEQNARIEEGRREYVKVLKRQQVMLAYMQQEIERALKELEKTPPEADKTVTEEAPQPKLNP